MRPRCIQLARVLKKSGSFYYHCDWHASHYVKVMADPERMQMWSGQAARFAQARPAEEITQELRGKALQFLA